MSLPPEVQILILNATILAVAYLGIYPTMRNLTAMRMAAVDGILTLIALFVAGALFWGTGTEFSLLLFSTNWAIFSFVTMGVMEYPLMRWFCRRNGIDLFGPEA